MHSGGMKGRAGHGPGGLPMAAQHQTQYAPAPNMPPQRSAPPPHARPNVMQQAAPAYAQHIPVNPARPVMRPGGPNPVPVKTGPAKDRRLSNRMGKSAPPVPSSGIKLASSKRSLALVAAFLVFFVCLSLFAIQQDKQAKAGIGTSVLSQTGAALGVSVSERINVQVRWVETALALRGSAKQIVNTLARGPNVTQAVMVDANGAVIAALPEGSKAFSTVSLTNFPQGGVRITAVISEGGVSNPVIVRKTSDVYVMTMLKPGSLIGGQALTGRTALIDRGQNVIDGSAAIAVNGVTGGFDLSANQVSRWMQSSAQGAAVPGQGNSRVTVAKVPNTDLTLLSRQALPAISLPSKLGVFALLFGSTALVMFTLMRTALSHVKSIRESQELARISQDRYRVAVEGGRGGVWEIDLKNNTVYVNRSLAKVLGLSETDQTIAVSQFLALFQPVDRERLLSTARRAHLQGEMDMEVRVTHLPVTLQMRGQSSQRQDTNGGVVLVGVAMDVTEQRGAQSRLQAAEARLFDALNSMTDSFVIWDAMGRLVVWNGRFEDFFGFEPGQLKPGMENQFVEHHGNNAIEDVFDGPELEGNIEIKLKDGRWIRYTESKTADGGLVSIGTNITEIREREQDLRDNENALRNTVSVLKKSQVRIMELAENYEQEKIRAEDANQSKSDFLANMSHELRTPLNAINGFSDIMKKEMFGPLGDPRYKEYVNDILFSGQHLLSLINDILDMSKIEAGKMTLNTDILQINEMISQVIRIVRGRAEDGRLKLIFDETVVQEIEADPRAVKQVLLNLITNAIKFTPEGGTVRVEAISKQTGIIIKVHDSGIGISQENIERLAKPFEQIESQHSKQHEGTGLGLALSKSLVELHGGNFLMESEPGQGTTVTFTLPNNPPAPKEVAPENEVANEINRLAQDIATVLGESKPQYEATHNQAPQPYGQEPDAA